MRGSKNDREFIPDRRGLIGLAVILLAAAAVFVCVHLIQSNSAKEETRADYRQYHGADDVLMEYGGVQYRLRKDLTVILLAGIDRDGDTEPTFRDGGQADFQRVVVIDSTNRQVRQIAIDRDTMAEVTTLSMIGKRTGTRTMQLSLAYAFGDGGTLSAELQAEAVSRLLLNVPVTEYAAMTMQGIAVLNDMVGGVEVTLAEDMTTIDPAFTAGATVILRGSAAERFIRARMSVGGTNEQRMTRQESYLSSLLHVTRTRLSSNRALIAQTYDALLPYLVTNIPKGRLVNEAWACRNYEWCDPVSISGTHRVGEDGFMEFHADPDSVRDTVLSVFFEPVKR